MSQDFIGLLRGSGATTLTLIMLTINPKIQVLIKPTQSRKTQKTIDMIREDHVNEDGHFFMYGCHCILAAANQTLHRIEDAYPDGDAPGDLIMFSSEEGKCGTAEAVVDKLMESTPTKYMGLCMLIHPARFKKRNGKDSDIMKILRRIEHRMPEITKTSTSLISTTFLSNILNHCVHFQRW